MSKRLSLLTAMRLCTHMFSMHELLDACMVAATALGVLSRECGGRVMPLQDVNHECFALSVCCCRRKNAAGVH